VRYWPISEVHERQLLCRERWIARVVLEQRGATPSDIVCRIECRPGHRWVLAVKPRFLLRLSGCRLRSKGSPWGGADVESPGLTRLFQLYGESKQQDHRFHLCREDVIKLRWLNSLLGPLMIDEVTLDVIDTVRVERLKAVRKSTVNRYLGLVRSILRRARDDWEWIDKVPKVKLFKEPPGRERSISVQQAETLLAELPAHQRDVVMFALSTGLRQSNVLGLEWSHVDLGGGHAWVGASQSKNRRPIAVPLNSTALEVLRRQIGKHPERVFTYSGQPIVQANTRAWRNALKRAGIENFPWHDLRHTWASWHRQLGTRRTSYSGSAVGALR